MAISSVGFACRSYFPVRSLQHHCLWKVALLAIYLYEQNRYNNYVFCSTSAICFHSLFVSPCSQIRLYTVAAAIEKMDEPDGDHQDKVSDGISKFRP